MTATPHVPFHQARQGACIEFEVFDGKPVRGTVEALSVPSPRSFLVLLNTVVDHEGNVKKGSDLNNTWCRAINLYHARRVLTHSDGPLVFQQTNPGAALIARDLAAYRTEGVVRRRGRRLVIDGNARYARGVARELLYEYLTRHASALGVLPWELVDSEKLLEALSQQGIVRTVSQSTPQYDPFPSRMDIHTEKLKRFIKRNINRFKCDTRAAARAHEALEEQMYQEEQELRLAA